MNQVFVIKWASGKVNVFADVNEAKEKLGDGAVAMGSVVSVGKAIGMAPPSKMNWSDAAKALRPRAGVPGR